MTTQTNDDYGIFHAGASHVNISIAKACLAAREWKVEKLIGEGTNGSVYLTCRKEECVYALKVSSFNNTEEYKVAKLADDMQFGPEIHDFFQCEDRDTKSPIYFTVLQKLDRTLKQHLHSTSTSFTRDDADDLYAFMMGFFNAGFVHFDMKEDNIMVKLKKDGTIERYYIIDYGVAYHPEIHGNLEDFFNSSFYHGFGWPHVAPRELYKPWDFVCLVNHLFYSPKLDKTKSGIERLLEYVSQHVTDIKQPIHLWTLKDLPNRKPARVRELKPDQRRLFRIHPVPVLEQVATVVANRPAWFVTAVTSLVPDQTEKIEPEHIPSINANVCNECFWLQIRKVPRTIEIPHVMYYQLTRWNLAAEIYMLSTLPHLTWLRSYGYDVIYTWLQSLPSKFTFHSVLRKTPKIAQAPLNTYMPFWIVDFLELENGNVPLNEEMIQKINEGIDKYLQENIGSIFTGITGEVAMSNWPDMLLFYWLFSLEDDLLALTEAVGKKFLPKQLFVTMEYMRHHYFRRWHKQQPWVANMQYLPPHYRTDDY